MHTYLILCCKHHTDIKHALFILRLQLWGLVPSRHSISNLANSNLINKRLSDNLVILSFCYLLESLIDLFRIIGLPKNIKAINSNRILEFTPRYCWWLGIFFFTIFILPQSMENGVIQSIKILDENWSIYERPRTFDLIVFRWYFEMTLTNGKNPQQF